MTYFWQNTLKHRQNPASDHVHQLPSGRWVVAIWDEPTARWYAPMTAADRRLTGARERTARRLEDLGTHTYATQAAALKFARHE